MERSYSTRPATLDDVNMLISAVISAERSGTEKLGLCTLFGIGENQLCDLLGSMFMEEIDGCEFSVSSFLLACHNGSPVAAMAGWVEGRNEDQMSSALLRTNLIGYTFPPDRLKEFQRNSSLLRELRLERRVDTLQIEYVYVDPAHRGSGLVGKMLQAHIGRSKDAFPELTIAQVQFFANNTAALKAYERAHFVHAASAVATDPTALVLLPFHTKLLYEKRLDHG